MRYRVATVIFKGNENKKYSFFVEDLVNPHNESIEAACCHAGDWCLCDTSAGLSVGKVVDIKEFMDRPKESYRFILWYMPESERKFLCDKYHKENIKKLVNIEIEDRKAAEARRNKESKEDDILDFLL